MCLFVSVYVFVCYFYQLAFLLVTDVTAAGVCLLSSCTVLATTVTSGTGVTLVGPTGLAGTVLCHN